MTCDQCRETVSAGLDEEASIVELVAVDAHLAGCPKCRAWSTQAKRLDRRLRVRVADPVPDLSFEVVAAAGDARQQRITARRNAAVRLGLVGVGIVQLGLALPDLGSHIHSGNEAASWGVAAAIGLLIAAASPRRVLGMLPVLSVAALVLALTTIHDVVDGYVRAGHELPHTALVVGVALLWLLRDRSTTAPRLDEEAIAPHRARPDAARDAA
jgi:predicted anti-sigma-YlaC factor YlaD